MIQAYLCYNAWRWVTFPTKYMGTKQTGHWVAAPDSRCRPVFSDDNGYLRASDLRHGNHSIFGVGQVAILL